VNFTFKKATKTQSRLRLALIGPSGSGKTYTSLAIATSLQKPVCVIDTERGSASKYADIFEFDVLELESFSPDTYCEAILAACRAEYGTIVIDSLSHAWMGKDGALEQVDRAAKRQSSGNTFMAWRDITPKHNRLVDTILNATAHVIVTMRTKTEYVLEENEKGKKVPRKVGLQPVQRDGLEYEFDVVGDLNLENQLTIGKTRCPVLAGQYFERPGKNVADILNAWITDGAPAPPPPAPAPAVPPADPTRTSHLAIVDALKARIAEVAASGDDAAKAKLIEEIKSADLPEILMGAVRKAYATAFAAKPAATAEAAK